MERRLNAARAAKMAGISRKQIQNDIQANKLDVFEGEVTVRSLMLRYPFMQMDNMKEIKRVARIQERAATKLTSDFLPADQVVVDQINRIQNKLNESQEQVHEYEDLIMQMHDRLVVMKENCDRQQKQTLTAFINWMMTQYKQSHG
ncbi:MAG: hypothetical protein ISR69_11975 [Gammaproteobacteria bacterium]|nr:hypothetical protein [Gammaproteobacteria bacterium]